MADESELHTYVGLIEMCVRGLAVLWLAVSLYIFFAIVVSREYSATDIVDRNQYTSSFLIMTELISVPSGFISKEIVQKCNPGGRQCSYRFDQNTFLGAMAIWSIYEILQAIFWGIVIKAISLLRARPV